MQVESSFQWRVEKRETLDYIRKLAKVVAF